VRLSSKYESSFSLPLNMASVYLYLLYFILEGLFLPTLVGVQFESNVIRVEGRTSMFYTFSISSDDVRLAIF
jgi:hypothetical protein